VERPADLAERQAPHRNGHVMRLIHAIL
jgi:hypothetical protein